MNEYIYLKIKKLYPDIDKQNQEVVNSIIEIALIIATNDGLTDENLILGTALLTLDMLFPSHSESGVSSRSIDGVSESYSSTYTYSKWKRLYDMLLNGTYDNSISLYYAGIDG